MAPDPWLSMYESTCHTAQEVAEKIQERNRCQRNGESATKLNVSIRSLLQNLKEKTERLKDLLLHSVSTRQITQLEGDRRQNLVDDLLTRHRHLQASFKNEGTEPDVIRSSLMAGGVRQGVVNPWLVEEPEETRGLGFHEIQQQQQRIIEEIIDDITNLVENTDNKLRNQTKRVMTVDRKSSSCGMMVVIVLLLIAIVIVAVWPTK
uniref:t-SNARE coiled-coil homology domain-containing protein n=1 Tax=Podarcis muralis TaxID=64176 RepID=A0A670JJK8_PODMU